MSTQKTTAAEIWEKNYAAIVHKFITYEWINIIEANTIFCCAEFKVSDDYFC